MKLSLFIFSYCALSCSPAFAGGQERGSVGENGNGFILSEESKTMATGLLGGIPFLSQNLRPFDTISFDLVREKRGADGTWFPVGKKTGAMGCQEQTFF
jgi:hypothetical protein